MKFQIDTNLKTIKIEEKANLKALLKVIKDMFPDDWEEYTIETNTKIEWVQNCINCPHKYGYRWSNPWWLENPIVYCQSDSNYLQPNKQVITSEYTLTSASSDAPNIINVETND